MSPLITPVAQIPEEAEQALSVGRLTGVETRPGVADARGGPGPEVEVGWPLEGELIGRLEAVTGE